jgi:hypothetical protein
MMSQTSSIPLIFPLAKPINPMTAPTIKPPISIDFALMAGKKWATAKHTAARTIHPMHPIFISYYVAGSRARLTDAHIRHANQLSTDQPKHRLMKKISVEFLCDRLSATSYGTK